MTHLNNLFIFLLIIMLTLTAGLAQAHQSSSDAYEYYKRGLTYHDKANYYGAIFEFTKAIQADPAYAKAFYNRGIVYTNLGRYNEAISDFTKAIQIDPTDALSYYNRGITYFLKKKYNKAWNDINEAIKIGVQIHPVFLQHLREDSGRE